MDIFDKQRYVFANLFLLSNKLQVLGNSYLIEDSLTTKQWFFILIVSQFKEPPMLTDVAHALGTSRQNVKQLALKLEEKGFLILEKDKSDYRALRIQLTEKNQWFWEKRTEKDKAFINNLFKNLTSDELNNIYQTFEKLSDTINNLKDFKEDEKND